MSCQFSGNTECLTSALHSELIQGVLKVSSFSSTWLNPCRGRWQTTMAMPTCGWHPLTTPFFPTFPIWKVGTKPLDGVPCNSTYMYLASKGSWTSCVRRKDQLLSVLGDGNLAHLSIPPASMSQPIRHKWGKEVMSWLHNREFTCISFLLEGWQVTKGSKHWNHWENTFWINYLTTFPILLSRKGILYYGSLTHHWWKCKLYSHPGNSFGRVFCVF